MESLLDMVRARLSEALVLITAAAAARSESIRIPSLASRPALTLAPICYAIVNTLLVLIDCRTNWS